MSVLVVVDRFGVGSAAMQVVDRLLFSGGWASGGVAIQEGEGKPAGGGEGIRVRGWEPAVSGGLAGLGGVRVAFAGEGAGGVEVRRRVADFGLVVEEDLAGAVGQSRAILVFPEEANGAGTGVGLLERVLEGTGKGASVFFHGALGATVAEAKRVLEIAEGRGVRLGAGTAWSTPFQLPPLEIRPGVGLEKALVVVQGGYPQAELVGFEALGSFIERRGGMVRGVRSVVRWKGAEVWDARRGGGWDDGLLAAAITRSDNPQGDPVRDGRCQDLVGLGLVEGLAKEPRGALVTHADGFRSVILVLDGVVTDVTVAIRRADGVVISTQLYRPPAPVSASMDRLLEVVGVFLGGGPMPWGTDRSVELVEFLGVLRA